MIDHVTLNVRDYAEGRRFYEQALAPLGYSVNLEFPEFSACGFGSDDGSGFWIAERGEASAPTHVALRAPDRKTVDRFYETAIAAGGKDNGPPGIRAHYHEHYYGAFVHDPDGNNVEAVCHAPG